MATISNSSNFDCVYIRYDITPAKYVTIAYKGRRSGYGSAINAQNLTGYLSVICNGTESCKGTDLFCPLNGPNCNVMCIGESSCAKMNFYIPNAEYDKLLYVFTFCFNMFFIFNFILYFSVSHVQGSMIRIALRSMIQYSHCRMTQRYIARIRANLQSWCTTLTMRYCRAIKTAVPFWSKRLKSAPTPFIA